MSSLNVDIENIEACNNHWRGARNIFQIGEDLELLLIEFKTFLEAEKELINYLLILNQQNPRIEEFKFFLEPNGKATFICVCVSDITTFKPDNFLKRNIIFDFKKQGKRLLFTDVTEDEWKAVKNINSDKKLPSTWVSNQSLTDKYNKYKNLFL